MTTASMLVKSSNTNTYDLGNGFKLVVDNTTHESGNSFVVHTLINSEGVSIPMGEKATFETLVDKLKVFT